MTEKEFCDIYMKKPDKQGTVTLGEGSILPKDDESYPVSTIREFGDLLMDNVTTLRTKQVLLMTLAHLSSKEALKILKAYNKNPDEELRIFAEFALDECKMWQD